MAYRFSGTDPFLRAAIGAFNGYRLRGNADGSAPQSAFALLKRNATGGWQGIWTVDQGSSSVYVDMLEFDPTNHLSGWTGVGDGYAGSTVITDTTNWMIVGYTWTGVAGAGQLTWWWKIGAGAWQSEAQTFPANGIASTVAGATFRHVIGNDPTLGDDGRMDVVCAGAIKSALSSAQVQSLTMTDIASWDAIFTGSGAWLLGFDAITTRTDRTGNGGDELSRSAGITLVADPTGFDWGGGTTPVSGQRRVVYSVAASVTGQRRVVYGVVQALTGQRRVAYGVLASATGQRRLVYAVMAPLAGQRRIAYGVLAGVSGQRRVAYSVASATGVSGSRTIVYGVLAAVSGQRRVVYAVTQSVTGQRRVAYTVIGGVSGVRRISYVVGTGAGIPPQLPALLAG